MEKVNGWNGGVAYRAEDVTLPEHRTLELWNTDGGHVGVSLRGSSGAVMYAAISPDDFAEMAEALGFGAKDDRLREGVEKLLDEMGAEASPVVGTDWLRRRLRGLLGADLPQTPGAGVLAVRRGMLGRAVTVEFRRTSDGKWASTAGHWAEGDAEMLERWRIVEVL